MHAWQSIDVVEKSGLVKKGGRGVIVRLSQTMAENGDSGFVVQNLRWSVFLSMVLSMVSKLLSFSLVLFVFGFAGC